MTRKRVDANQYPIILDLRKRGCSVQPLSALGHGCPDILVGHDFRCYVFEIKDPSQPPSKRHLTADEVTWHSNWKGQVNVIETADEAWELMQ